VERSALVTGAASGLGAATAARLEEDGYGVVRLDAADGDGVLRGDVTRPDDVARALAAASLLAPVRVVVACAGIAGVGRVVGHDPALFRRTIDVNVIGSFTTLSLAAETMAGQAADADGQRGVIILTSSIAAFDGQIGQVAYSASKGAIAALVLPAARDLARAGIRVVAIAPGIFDTPLLAALPEAARAALGAAVPNPARLGRPEEFADLVAAIVGNPMLNGETIRLDGALRMAPR
jgi:NAD(P)-dependent dehydrogenase (short-subunit alcohol dehydrogenase family)